MNSKPSKEYIVTERKISQLMPASGMRAVYDDTEPVVSRLVALALCRVREDVYQDGACLEKGEWYTAVCGVETCDRGFAICEECDNLLGYLEEGEALSDEWLIAHEAKRALAKKSAAGKTLPQEAP